MCTGNGRAAGDVILDKRAHNAVFKLAFEVDHVKREAAVLGDAAGVIDIIARAAAMLDGTVGSEMGQAAVVPELHGESDNDFTIAMEQACYDGAVDPAAHGDDYRWGKRRRVWDAEANFGVRTRRQAAALQESRWSRKRRRHVAGTGLW